MKFLSETVAFIAMALVLILAMIFRFAPITGHILVSHHVIVALQRMNTAVFVMLVICCLFVAGLLASVGCEVGRWILSRHGR